MSNDIPDYDSEADWEADYIKQKYKRFAIKLQCSEKILLAIEQVTGESFMSINTYRKISRDVTEIGDAMLENLAYKLWEAHGQNDDEVLAALPIKDAVDGETVSWGGNSFAEFDGVKWLAA
jgi:hypothetical protein